MPERIVLWDRTFLTEVEESYQHLVVSGIEIDGECGNCESAMVYIVAPAPVMPGPSRGRRQPPEKHNLSTSHRVHAPTSKERRQPPTAATEGNLSTPYWGGTPTSKGRRQPPTAAREE